MESVPNDRAREIKFLLISACLGSDTFCSNGYTPSRSVQTAFRTLSGGHPTSVISLEPSVLIYCDCSALLSCHYVLLRAIEISQLSSVVRPPYYKCAKKSKKNFEETIQPTFYLLHVPLHFFFLFIRRCPVMGRTIVANLYSVLSDTASSHRVCASGREREK